MHLHFESSPNAKCDCPLLSLTWMGKVPDEMPDEEGWKLNRTNYYQEGWLATGNVRGVVGVTFTSCHCKKVYDAPLRTNYNLRGHRSEVSLVKWNEPYQKLASCDSSGIIFVWIKYEGRWSIELINDRNTQVTDFSWSHDGRMALICYQDGFVLVGSVAGQRYWSHMLNIQGTITCGVWTPDDQQVLFGTSDGQIIIMDVHGLLVAQVSVLDATAICSLSWSCEKFKMEEGDDDDVSETSRSIRAMDKPSFLATCFVNGLVYIMKNYDDVCPIIVPTELQGMKMEWNNSGDILAIAGYKPNATAGEFTNIVKFYSEYGLLRYTANIPHSQHPVSALTWGHNDKRVFIATGPQIHVGWVTRKVASLQLLSRLAIYRHLPNEELTLQLLLPKRLRSLITSLFQPTIKTCFPLIQRLREFVCQPPIAGGRHHCTMIRHDDDLNLSSGTCYTLYLEYLGGLVPLLKGKRSSKIRPEFIIFDPQATEVSGNCEFNGDTCSLKVNGLTVGHHVNGNCHTPNGLSDVSDSEYEDGCASPRMQRRRRQWKKMLKEQMQMELELRLFDNFAYMDTLPESDRLVEVTSNIWGTKFKMHGIDEHLPANLGHITYKTSLLHLQPRQMTLSVTELRDDLQPDNDPAYNPNVFSEDEDEIQVQSDDGGDFPQLCHLQKEGAPIAPMTPQKHHMTNGLPHRHMQHGVVTPTIKSQTLNAKSPGGEVLPPLLPPQQQQSSHHRRSDEPSGSGTSRGDPSDEIEEFPYVDFTNSPELLSLIERESQLYAACEGLQSRTASVSSQLGKTAIGGADRSTHCDKPISAPVEFNSAGTVPVTAFGSPFPRRIQTDLRSTSFVSCSSSSNATTSSSSSSNSTSSESASSDSGASLAASSPAGAQWCHHAEISWSRGGKYSPTPSTTTTTTSTTVTTPLSTFSTPNATSEGSTRTLPRWAEKACDLKFIDEDDDGVSNGVGGVEWNGTTVAAVRSSQAHLFGRCRSQSVGGHLNSIDVANAAVRRGDVARVGSLREMKRRLILSQDRRQQQPPIAKSPSLQRPPRLVQSGKSRSLDSGGADAFREDPPAPTPALTAKGQRGCTAGITAKPKNVTRFPVTMPVPPPPLNQVPAVAFNLKGRDSPPLNIMTSSPIEVACSVGGGGGGGRSSSPPSKSYVSPAPPSPPSHHFKVWSSLAAAAAASLSTSSSSSSSNCTPDGPRQGGCSSFFSCRSSLTRPANLLRSPSTSLPASPLADRRNQAAAAAATATSTPPPPKRSFRNTSDRKDSLRRKSLLNSPLLSRRSRCASSKVVESSDDEVTYSGDEGAGPGNYKDLESFQKAHIRQKLKRERVRHENGVNKSPVAHPKRREFIMHNKAPLWNENSQVYQLDFGGRVTQESAKNFQIEFRGKQVMQFGRIDGNAYTLDFQYPFTAIQAFAVALANVTQRLK